MPAPETCCTFDGALRVGDTAAVITIRSGSPDPISGLVIAAEGCGTDCDYQDDYVDRYCDPTEGGTLPGAYVSDIIYTIDDMPANSILIIDAAEETVTLTDYAGTVHPSLLDVIDWSGLFEWIQAARGGCQRICLDSSGATLNSDTTVEISTYDREV